MTITFYDLRRDIGNYACIKTSKILPEADLVADLSIVGDDGYDLIEYLAKKYRLDLTGLDFYPHFGNEPPGLLDHTDPLRVDTLLALLNQAPTLPTIAPVPLTQQPVLPPPGNYERNRWIYFFTGIDTAERSRKSELQEFKNSYRREMERTLQSRNPDEVYRLWQAIGMPRRLTDFFLHFFTTVQHPPNDGLLLYIPEDRLVCLDSLADFENIEMCCNQFGFRAAQFVGYATHHTPVVIPPMEAMTSEQLQIIYAEFQFNLATFADLVQSIRLFHSKKCFQDPFY